jgi:formate/nitrite transporter
MDSVLPAEILSEALRAGERKAHLPVRDLLIRGILAGAFLGYATSLASIVVTQGVPPIVGALLFPVGFVMLVLLGLELVTGNFALLPAALLDRRIGAGALLRNWTWVYIGNLIGSVLYAYLLYAAITSFGAANGGPLAEQIRQTALKKTLAYEALGAAGWATAFLKAVLCNWMVTIGTLLAFCSKSTAGKIVAMWLPITTFFAQGFEHSVVNMYAIPAGKLLGAPIPLAKWWIWNQIPVTLGNLVAGALLTGAALWWTHGQRQPRAIEETGAAAKAG